jgi:hypothetical protein
MWEEDVVPNSKEDDGLSPAKRDVKTTEDEEVAVSAEEEEAGTGNAEAGAEADAEDSGETEEDSTPSDEGTVSVTASGAKRGRRAAAADGITAGKTPRRGGRGGRGAARAAGRLRPHALVA